MTKNFEKSLFWIFYNKEKFGSDFAVEEFGWHKNESGYEFEECRVNNIIQIVYSGTCYLTVWDEGKEYNYVLHAGEAFVISAGVRHKYVSDLKDTCSRYWLSCSGYEYDSMLPLLGVDKKFSVISGINCDKVFKSFKVLKSTMKHTHYSIFEIYSEAYSILSIVSRAVNDRNSEIESKAKHDVFIDSVIRYIEKNLKENLKVKSLANFFGYERSYFYKVFKNNVGMSIQDYITKKRINYARTLITDTDKTFLEIAKEVGYSNYSSFFRMFIQVAGSTPEAYRHEYKKN